MQDDYFLKSEVNHQILNFFYMQFLKHRFDCLHITDQCTSGPFSKNTGIKNIWEINKTATYRVSTQVAFWDKNTLKGLLRNHETGWQFEHFGSLRSKYIPLRLMCVSQDEIIKDKNEILPYDFTGIINGKWKEEVVQLFETNNISVNFEKRGFYIERQKTKKERFYSFICIRNNKNRLRSHIDLLTNRG